MSKRIEDIFLQEKLTEIEPVGDEEKIMAKLKPDKAQIWEEIIQINAEGMMKAQEFVRLEKDLMKLRVRFESKRFLFWDMIEQADERFESAAQRGKVLAIRKDEDGSLVVVEFDAPKQNIGGIFIMPPEGLDGLQGLMGGGE